MIALVTGVGGLIGSATARFFIGKGFAVVGIDNDSRSYFFGPDASTAWNVRRIREHCPGYRHHDVDIRNADAVDAIFSEYGSDIKLVIHAAAQPSHDWAAREPFTDFGINAGGTLTLLEAVRGHCPDAVFIFTSTNKVYGDKVNMLRFRELETRYELDESEPYAQNGVDESMTIDQSTHSLFGVAKASADLLVQEYGKYFAMKTGVFRGGCLTGPDHSAAQLHGFLAYLIRCAVTGTPYTIFGYKGKQVRDNIHANDVANVFWHFYNNPRPGEVYNLGGGRHSNISMLEAVACCEKITGRKMDISATDEARIGDHKWWISDMGKFMSHYPEWKYTYTMADILEEMHAGIVARSEGKDGHAPA